MEVISMYSYLPKTCSNSNIELVISQQFWPEAWWYINNITLHYFLGIRYIYIYIYIYSQRSFNKHAPNEYFKWEGEYVLRKATVHGNGALLNSTVFQLTWIMSQMCFFYCMRCTFILKSSGCTTTYHEIIITIIIISIFNTIKPSRKSPSRKDKMLTKLQKRFSLHTHKHK